MSLRLMTPILTAQMVLTLFVQRHFISFGRDLSMEALSMMLNPVDITIPLAYKVPMALTISVSAKAIFAQDFGTVTANIDTVANPSAASPANPNT